MQSIRNRSGIARETIIVALRHAINAAISATSKAHDATSSMLASKLYGQSVKHAVIHHAMLWDNFRPAASIDAHISTFGLIGPVSERIS